MDKVKYVLPTDRKDVPKVALFFTRRGSEDTDDVDIMAFSPNRSQNILIATLDAQGALWVNGKIVRVFEF